ncbi:unnamed protein product [Effrenium voratum]|nr:unnamed protein product [Effrenium voratum]CAJ1461380.1 unnamed protein product [Effrenium voratum]
MLFLATLAMRRKTHHRRVCPRHGRAAKSGHWWLRMQMCQLPRRRAPHTCGLLLQSGRRRKKAQLSLAGSKNTPGTRTTLLLLILLWYRMPIFGATCAEFHARRCSMSSAATRGCDLTSHGLWVGGDSIPL